VTRRLRGIGSIDVLCTVLVLAVIARVTLPAVWAVPALQTWCTVFVAVCVQATPYVLLGVLLSTAVAALPDAWLSRVLPNRPALAVPIAAVAGVAMPGCECGSVPLAAGLMRRGVATGPALALLLSAPATNPIVLAATAAAFPGEPAMVFARFLGSFMLALTVGWMWTRRIDSCGPPTCTVDLHQQSGRVAGAATELARSLGLLAIGAACAALLTTCLPQGWMTQLGRAGFGGVVTLAGLAVLLGVCSEADAFIARSLTQFSRTAQLTFMIVGPAIDVKLLAMQLGTFGSRFTIRLAPLVFALAVSSALAVGAVVL
jgi:uncharacterized membrane protein YraQ (UPF0718 family)